MAPCSLDASATGAERERGYVLATTALMLVPLMIFAAFAVDVGAWYVEADRDQRAADAAALAAVPHLPDWNDASDAALEIVRANGLTDAVKVSEGGDFNAAETRPQVKVEKLPNDQVRVSVRTLGETYFGSVIENFDGLEITRVASADFNLPVPMGSPYNILGFGVPFAGEPASNVLLTLEGYCNDPQNGDRRGNAFLNQNGCGVVVPEANAVGDTIDTYEEGLAYVQANSADRVLHPLFVPPAGGGLPEGRQGYRFVIDVPASTGPTSVHIFDAPACQGTGIRGVSENSSNADQSDFIKLTFQLYDATATPLDDSDIVPIGGLWRPVQPDSTSNNNNQGCNQWTQLPLPSDLTPGRYYLDVRNDETHRGGFVAGTNFFAIQARENGLPDVVDSRVDNASPEVYALTWLPVRAAMNGVTDAIFQLASIDPDRHQGKVLEITMYDPSEGMQYIRILDPAGQPLAFEWDTDDNGVYSQYSQKHNSVLDGADPFGGGLRSSATCLTVSDHCLDVTGSRKVLWRNWGTGNSAQFNGRELTIRVPLGYGANAGMTWADPTNPDDHWFEVRYTCATRADGTCIGVSDVTTWKVKVIGDPVRLTE